MSKSAHNTVTPGERLGRKTPAAFEFFDQIENIGIFYLSPDGIIQYSNLCWTRLTGIRREKALQTTWTEIFDPADRPRVACEWDAMRQNHPAQQSIFHVHSLENGKQELIFRIFTNKTKRGKVKGFLGTVHPASASLNPDQPILITREELDRYLTEHTRSLNEANQKLKEEVKGRKRVTADLRESEKRFRLLADAAFEGIMMTDCGRILDVNKQILTLFQSRREDFIGHFVNEFITPVSEIILKNQVSLKSGSKPEYIALRKDGSTFPVDLHSRDLKFNKKTIRLIIIRDVTEYKTLETAERLAKENMEILRQAMMEMATDRDLKSVLDKTLFYLGKIVPYHRAAVLMVEDGRLQMAAGRGFENSEVSLSQYLQKIHDHLAKSNQGDQVTVLEHLDEDPDFEPFWEAREVAAWAIVPMKSHSGMSGYLTIAPRKAANLSPREIDFLQVFANEAAIAIENAELFEKVQTLAITDPLTQLYNRRYFFDIAEKEWLRSNRYEHPLTIIMLDIDRFKRVNDRFGHAVGDTVLVQLAEACRKVMRCTDLVARYGGEEFVILLPETDLPSAQEVAERLQQNIQQIEVTTRTKPVNITVSMGIAANSPDCRSVDDLLDRADKALYQSKKAGRNRFSCWSSTGEAPSHLD